MNNGHTTTQSQKLHTRPPVKHQNKQTTRNQASIMQVIKHRGTNQAQTRQPRAQRISITQQRTNQQISTNHVNQPNTNNHPQPSNHQKPQPTKSNHPSLPTKSTNTHQTKTCANHKHPQQANNPTTPRSKRNKTSKLTAKATSVTPNPNRNKSVNHRNKTNQSAKTPTKPQS